MERKTKAFGAIELAADRLHDEIAAVIDAAFEEFVGHIDPAVLYVRRPSERDFMAVEMCFSEWLVVERPLRDGLTPLQLAAQMPPDGVEAADVRALEEVAASQFFSRFAICGKDVQAGVASLCDVRSGALYEVLAPHVCENDRWRDGSIALRIACVDGRWQEAGKVDLYDRCAPGPVTPLSAGEVHPDDENLPEALRASYYLRLVRDLMGIDGLYRKTVRIVDAAA